MVLFKDINVRTVPATSLVTLSFRFSFLTIAYQTKIIPLTKRYPLTVIYKNLKVKMLGKE